MRRAAPTLLLFLALVGLPAVAGAISEVIPLDRAKRGTVSFTHRRHAYDLDVACNRCHHNIEPLRSGETSCKGCHADRNHSGLCHRCHLSNRDRDYRDEAARLQRELGREKIPNLFKAFHNLCRNCHREANQREGRKAPYECGGCHR